MRELKFRVWDKRTNKWIDNFRIYMHGNIECYAGINANPEWQPYAQEFYHLMQYTGLKDKNGKDIYEGDIVEFSGYKRDYKELIEWENIGKHTSFGAGTHNARVIGNIYENKELI